MTLKISTSNGTHLFSSLYCEDLATEETIVTKIDRTYSRQFLQRKNTDIQNLVNMWENGYMFSYTRKDYVIPYIPSWAKTASMIKI